MCPDRRAAYHAALTEDALAMLASPDMACLGTLRGGLERYLVDRIPTGGFLRCVLENDWIGAIRKAHHSITMEQMRALHHVLAGAFPAPAWGSPEKVAAWLAENEDVCHDPL